jgi:hypothetical protein
MQNRCVNALIIPNYYDFSSLIKSDIVRDAFWSCVTIYSCLIKQPQSVQIISICIGPISSAVDGSAAKGR